jgi:uncharacterized membrane protein YeaQ/YmgE (transglycosylase-associated protein family)
LILVFAAIAGWFADLVIPGKMPYGWIGGIVAGLIGGWLGGKLLGGFGPSVCAANDCYYLIPGIIGAISFAFLARFVLGMVMGGNRRV